MRRYDDLVPGAAAIIMQMAQDQAAHRRKLESDGQKSDSLARERQLEIENKRISGTIWNDRIGLILGWLVAIGCVVGGTWAMVEDRSPWMVAIFLGLPVAALVKAVTGKK